ncbi:MAG: hypothetical protein JW995_01530 [Melioribacteraceae bacterium]|nr:hypothetical protein [Melioribacteraceae bacterium]
MTLFKRGIQFIDTVRKFHHTLREFYSNLSNETQKEKIKIALGYLSEHERHMEETFGFIEENLSRKIEETWFSYIDDSKAEKCLKSFDLSFKDDINEIVSAVIIMDDCLIKLYKELADHSNSDEVRAVFENLAEFESHEMRRTVRNIKRYEKL